MTKVGLGKDPPEDELDHSRSGVHQVPAKIEPGDGPVVEGLPERLHLVDGQARDVALPVVERLRAICRLRSGVGDGRPRRWGSRSGARRGARVVALPGRSKARCMPGCSGSPSAQAMRARRSRSRASGLGSSSSRTMASRARSTPRKNQLRISSVGKTPAPISGSAVIRKSGRLRSPGTGATVGSRRADAGRRGAARPRCAGRARPARPARCRRCRRRRSTRHGG